jgi:hypothetical protein
MMGKKRGTVARWVAKKGCVLETTTDWKSKRQLLLLHSPLYSTSLVAETVHWWEGNESVKERKESEEREGRTGLAGTLESVNNVEGGDGLALGVLSVGDRIADDVLRGRERIRKRYEGRKKKRRRTSRKILRTPRVSS